MDYLDAYRFELQTKLLEKGWHRYDGEMWVRDDDRSQSFNWKYLVVHMFLGKTPRKKSRGGNAHLERGTRLVCNERRQRKMEKIKGRYNDSS